MTTKARVALADFLDRVLHSETRPEDFDVQWGSLELSEPLDRLYAVLPHYLSDYRIRARDPWYREMQEHELKKMICLLREEAQ